MSQPTLDAVVDEAPPPEPTGLQHMGDPLPWPRAGAKILKRKDGTDYIKFYVPAEADERSEQIGLLWKAAGLPFFKNERLRLRAEFLFARPGGHYGTGRNAGTIKPQFMDARPGGVGHKNADGRRTGGDLDNLCKLILDALNEIAYTDDGQIVRIEAEKAYIDQAGVDRPQTIFDVTPLSRSDSAF